MVSKLIGFLCIFMTILLHGNDVEEDDVMIFQSSQEPLFVSLGSWCEVAHALKACEIRNAAYPFDWITSIDSERFLEVLQDDFHHFFDEAFLVVGGRDPGYLLHTYYRLEFLHDGDFRDLTTMQKFKDKYQRRIERFRMLAEYPGKVFFVRTAYAGSTTDLYYLCADNLEISDGYAWKLYRILQERFPKLDFTLVIINNDENHAVYEEKKLTEKLIKVRSHPGAELSHKKKLFVSLMNEKT
jgi:hypothetical protein